MTLCLVGCPADKSAKVPTPAPQGQGAAPVDHGPPDDSATIALLEKLGAKNQLAVPRLEKIVISMGLGKAVTSGEKGKMEQAEKELGVIAGQRPVRCKAKKSVSILLLLVMAQ